MTTLTASREIHLPAQGRGGSQGPLPASQQHLLALPGEAKAVPTFTECHLTVPGTTMPFQKPLCQSLCLFGAKPQLTRGPSPRGLLSPDAQVQSLGTKVGLVLETSTTTRRCGQTFH